MRTLNDGNYSFVLFSQDLSAIISYVFGFVLHRVALVYNCVLSMCVYIQRTLNDLLDLVTYACDNQIQVRYRTVNKYEQSSSWSLVSFVDVYGCKLQQHTYIIVCMCRYI